MQNQQYPQYPQYGNNQNQNAYTPTPNNGQNSRGSGAWKGIVGGAIAGAAVSATLVAALAGPVLAGLNNGKASPAQHNPAQTTTINTASDDATVSEAVANKCLPSVVSINVTTPSGEGIGSGVVLDTEGHIITNWHVAGDATSMKVTIEGNTYDATLVGGDASSDVAVIKANLNGAIVTPIEVGDSSELVVGDWVMTLGSPLGLDQSVSTGIVSALYRNQLMADASGNTLYTNLIQVDAAINGGNSGGALVNDKGQLVGINSLLADASGGGSFSGIGFAIPGNYAVDIANKVINGEQVTHAYIGLSCATVNEQTARQNNLSASQGAYVAELAQNGPAQAAGIQVGDIVTKVGDHDVESADDLLLAVRSYSVGDKVEVKLVRGGSEQTIAVTLGSDEALQASQEEAKRAQEQQQQQMEQYNQYNNQYNQRDQYDQYEQFLQQFPQFDLIQ